MAASRFSSTAATQSPPRRWCALHLHYAARKVHRPLCMYPVHVGPESVLSSQDRSDSVLDPDLTNARYDGELLLPKSNENIRIFVEYGR